jgi:hypothetical protein
MVAADTFMDLLQDLLTIPPGNTLHEYSRSGSPSVKLVSHWYVGLGPTDELLSQVLVGGNLLLADVVDEGLSPVHIDHHDLLAWLRRH